MRTAVIYGAGGQDGSYLAEHLLERDYLTYGVLRRASNPNDIRIRHLRSNPNFIVVEGDVTDAASVTGTLSSAKPDEVYNLAAQSVTEDSLCPMFLGQGVRYVTFGKLWREHEKKNKLVRIETVGGLQVQVIDITSKFCRAMGYWNGMGTWFPVKQISRHWYSGPVATLHQKFGSVTVTPNHSLLDVNQQVCKPADNPWMLNVRKVNYDLKELNEISLCLDGVHSYEDGWLWKQDVGRVGKVLKQLSGRSLEAFCRFVGAFVTEGWTSHNTANGQYITGVCQQDKEWLKEIEKECEHFFDGGIWLCEGKKDGYESVWQLQLKSKALYSLMRKLCGTYSNKKHLPPWFFSLPLKYKRVVFDKMLEGDGCVGKWGWRYGTTSYKLACQLSLLATELGYEYTVDWASAEDNNGNYDAWRFRECTTYCPNQGEKGKTVEWSNYEGWVYDLSVENVNNFAVGVGNIVVHNSHVHTSFQQPSYTTNATYIGCLNILEAVRALMPSISPRIYQASSSEMFGTACSRYLFCDDSRERRDYFSYKDVTGQVFQDESTPFVPASPYAIAKLAAHHLTGLYRRSYNIFSCSGILFNHESERRSEQFVTRKITRYIGRLVQGKVNGKLRLGNLDACRDWAHAKDYMEAAWLMLQQDKPDDYVIATGETHSVREFVQKAFGLVGLNWEEHVEIDRSLFRPSEVPYLRGDSSKARKILKWAPKVTFDELVKEMVESDIALAAKED